MLEVPRVRQSLAQARILWLRFFEGQPEPLGDRKPVDAIPDWVVQLDALSREELRAIDPIGDKSLESLRVRHIILRHAEKLQLLTGFVVDQPGGPGK